MHTPHIKFRNRTSLVFKVTVFKKYYKFNSRSILNAFLVDLRSTLLCNLFRTISYFYGIRNCFLFIYQTLLYFLIDL